MARFKEQVVSPGLKSRLVHAHESAHRNQVAEEIRMIEEQQFAHPIHALSAVVSGGEVRALQEAVKHVFVSETIKQYLVDLTFATRENDSLYLGSSPRGSLGLFRTGQAYAAMQGRDFVLPDDIKALAEAVLAHRVMVNPSARLKQVTPKRVIGDLLQRVPMPDADLSKAGHG